MLSRLALIVDDSKTATAVLKHQLNQFDVMVESASDGNLALEMLRDHQPDVIFLDHIMPGLDGFEVLQLLKNNHATRGIPVIISNHDTEEVRAVYEAAEIETFEVRRFISCNGDKRENAAELLALFS